MTSEQIIQGMPYFPGEAAGELCTSARSLTSHRIALIRPEDIGRIAVPPAGFIILDPTPFSHNLIALLGIGVPVVLIETGQARSLRTGMQVHINGLTGRIDTGRTLPARAAPPEPQLQDRACTTADGTAVNLLASVRSASAARRAVAAGARGIGLVRSEFLMPPDGGIPDAGFYRHSFHELLAAASPLPVTVRLLDMAADKQPDWLSPATQTGQPLGLQGVRLYHTPPVRQVVQDQLTVLGELAPSHAIRLLVPFIVRLEEFCHWQQQVRELVPDTVPVGAMAETLACVLDISRLLDSADFVAIGCNDLMQALYSADRDAAELRYYLDPYAPMLFRLFRQIVDSAGDRLECIQLCGVLPQIRGVLPVLLGLGYRSFSVDAPFIPYLADNLAGVSMHDCTALAADICAARTTQESLEILGLPPLRHPPYLL